jgi:hypothetical protein
MVVRRSCPAWLLMVLLFALYIVSAASAHADGGSGGCNVVKDPTCTVSAGGGLDAGGSSDAGGGSGSSRDPCAAYPDAVYGDRPPKVSRACADELQGTYCNAILGAILGGLKYPSVNNLTPEQTALVNNDLARSGCPAIVTTATLAQQAFDSIAFPHPSGHRSPSEAQDYNGYPFTYVGLWTYYWTDPATWRPLTATASAAGLTATVTATPKSLSFDPRGWVGQPVLYRSWSSVGGVGR